MPTAETCLLHGIKSLRCRVNFVICCGPARQTLAPESGNMFILTGLILWYCGRHGDNSAGIL